MGSDWLPAFAAVDRAAFLPDTVWPFDMATQASSVISKADDPEAWFQHADTDRPITTQWDDGNHHGCEPGRVATSSSSAPGVVFGMLQDLGVADGQRVLEIGTGTGWNTALLAHRLGGANVTSLEVDPAVGGRARDALHRAGALATVAVADGLFGYPQHAPYDRVLATCGVRDIPFAWVRQSAAGGLIVAPWGTHFSNRDAVARLTVADDVKSATGYFTGPVEFMKVRSQRLPPVRHAAYVPERFHRTADISTTTLTAQDGFDDRFGPFLFVAGLRVPHCLHAGDARGSARSDWFYSLSDLSWAAVLFQDGTPESTVYQAGPRRLWDEVEAAYDWWDGQGRPGLSRFGLTVTAEGQDAWLDDPAASWPV
ncbi:methyltransferase domain-containing protein [Streptomyces sp. NPDC006733]|uniref:methyltransferase domain-containing protein n=1 Tax=Streptomyces sp. NPDC006733 TaxID=3155460 RepID=UPI0033C5FC5E